MNDILFDAEVYADDLLGYGQESEYYGEEANNYYDEEGDEEDNFAGEEYYSEEYDATEAKPSLGYLGYYNARAVKAAKARAQAARERTTHAARVRAAKARAARARAARARAARARAARATRARAARARARAVRTRYGYGSYPPPMGSQNVPSKPAGPRDFPAEPMEPTNFPTEPITPFGMEPGDFPLAAMEPTDFPAEPIEPSAMEPGDIPQAATEPGDFPELPMEPEDFTAMVESGDEDMWLDEAEALAAEETAELAEALREVLHEDYREATPEEMQGALLNILGTMTPAEGINFGKILRQIRRAGKKVLDDPTVGQIAQVVLPVAGATVGTLVSGPTGTAIGGKLGQAAGQAFSKGSQPSSAAATAPASPSSPQGGSVAAAQLLQLTQNPDVLKSLSSLALGSLGNVNVKLGNGGPSVPVGGVMNLIGTLAGKAAADADELLREGEHSPSYLLDEEGQFLGDPAVPEDRAQALYNALSDAENERLGVEEAAAIY